MKIKIHVMPVGTTFSLKVRPSETIRHLKEKVKNYLGTAIDHQSFYYGRLDHQLEDEWTVSHCQFYPGTCVLLQVHDEHHPPSMVTLNVKVPRSQDRIPFEMDKDETILHLKVKIAARQDMGGVPVERIVLQSPCVEWHDDQVLQNILSSKGVDLDVFLKPLAAATSSSSRLAQLPNPSCIVSRRHNPVSS